ncbi:MAG: hypothetical protein IVW57_03620 [Ktedonobacterales bacterium]|nr:hypothetical protein [Ktedonobacterales bacterium]
MARIVGVPPAPTADSARARGSLQRFAIAPRHVRALLWLRWKLTLRGYSRNWRQVLGLIFMLLYLVPISVLLAVGTSLAYTLLDRAIATQLLFAALGLVYLAWAVLPLLQYSLNEGLDITKLQTYPLTRGEQMVSLVLSTLLDPTTLLILAVLIGAFVGWQATPLAGAITLAALALAYVHTVMLSQLALAALMGMLRSRRYRDLLIVFFALFGAVCSVANQVFFRAFRFSAINAPSQPHLETYLQWIPPGMAARAITLANAGQYQQTLPWLIALIALVPLVMALWARVLDRGITTAETAGATRSGRRTRRRARGAPATTGQAMLDQRGAAIPTPRASAAPSVAARSRRRVLSGAALAIARKETRYYWRDPQIKAMLLGSLAFLVIIFLPNLYSSPRTGIGPSSDLLSASQVIFAPLPALYIALNLSLNALGLERQALQTLYLFPIRPLDILWGKNLAAGTLSLAVQSVLIVGLAALTGGWRYVPLAVVVGLAGVLVLLGCGNVSSVLLPFRVRQMRMGSGNTGTEGGCLRSLLSMVVLAITLVLLVPVAAALAVPLLFQHTDWFIISLPLAIVYGIVLHQTTSRLIAPYILSRGPEILRVTAPES